MRILGAAIFLFAFFLGTKPAFCTANEPVPTATFAGIHNVPIVIEARDIGAVQYHVLDRYRVFRTAPDGTAVPIPFQIDEKDKFGDYILDKGPHPNIQYSNGIFDYQDELSIMGNDVGPRNTPTKWPFARPAVLYELVFERKNDVGAVYIGTYYKDPPPLAQTAPYVIFDTKNDAIYSSRYLYLFNKKNYLVVRDVDIRKPLDVKKDLIASSSLYMKIDLKYFLTFHVGHSSIESALDAYRVGPVRATARVNFDYKIAKMKFDIGMYTEVSFFSNAVYLPAVIDNPLEGKKALNKGSYFYYGLAVEDSPAALTLESNMPDFNKKEDFLSLFKGKSTAFDQYWVTTISPDYMVYLEFRPSVQMQKDGNVPFLYVEKVPAKDVVPREKGSAEPLGKSPVNVAVAFDLDNLQKGLHEVKFRLFVESYKRPEYLEEFKTAEEWKFLALRLRSKAY
ncbi:MAG: hypothetical protein HYW48_07835 [Deltaproteobacteria bacterium]|nr:hypothetical protein [Deltaproteobacteria bacterium]